MENEIQSIINLIIHVINLSQSNIPTEKLDIFSRTLTCGLHKYKPTQWDKEFAFNKSDKKQLVMRCYITPVIVTAYKKAEISEKHFRSSLPRFFTISFDTDIVLFQIGKNGPECVLYNENSLIPWEYKEIHETSENSKLLWYDLETTIYHYLKFKSTYHPWDGRRLDFDDYPFDINGNSVEDEEYNDYYSSLYCPNIITENDDLEGNFQIFVRWFKFNIQGVDPSDISARHCAEEYIASINGDPTSDLVQKHYDYMAHPARWEKYNRFECQRPKSNLYWITYYKDFKE